MIGTAFIPVGIFVLGLISGLALGRGSKGNQKSLSQSESPRALQAADSRAIDIVNRHVTMARARAIRVDDNSVTVIYARENKTKGKVKFDMDTAFDDVCEGDVGVLTIVDIERHGMPPFYKFTRDADIPTIDDVLKIGTGDPLLDDVFKALKESQTNDKRRSG